MGRREEGIRETVKNAGNKEKGKRGESKTEETNSNWIKV